MDDELEQLLRSLGLDPASPDAYRDGFLLLACLHHDVGKPRRSNKNAAKLSADDDLILIHEMIQLMDRGLNQEQAIAKLAGDPSKVRPLRLKPTSSKAQRVETLSKRVSAIKKKFTGLESAFGNVSIATVEKCLINMAFAEVGKNKPAF